MKKQSYYFDRPLKYSAEEWKARQDLACMYRIFDHFNWDESIYNHISLRVPGEPEHFLINPFGLHYSEVKASNLVKIDIDGNIVGDSDWPINPAGFTFHSAIHKHVPDGHCIMHVHTTPTLAVCCLEEGLSFTNFYSAQLHNQVAYHDFEGITVRMDEGDRIVASSEGKKILMLRNHGPVIIGADLPQAFSLMWLLNRACEVQLASMSMGKTLNIPDSILERCARDTPLFNPKYGSGRDAVAAFERLMDKKDPSYKY